MPYDGVDGGHWRALPKVDVDGALDHPHDARDDAPCPWHSYFDGGAFLSLDEHYGWCSTCILRLHGKDALNVVLYPLDVGDDHERMYVDEDSCFLAPLLEGNVGAPLFL